MSTFGQYPNSICCSSCSNAAEGKFKPRRFDGAHFLSRPANGFSGLRAGNLVLMFHVARGILQKGPPRGCRHPSVTYFPQLTPGASLCPFASVFLSLRVDRVYYVCCSISRRVYPWMWTTLHGHCSSDGGAWMGIFCQG